MHNLRRLGLAISLTIALSGTALAGETTSPPCVNPGETTSPPCSSEQLILEESTQAPSNVSDEAETIVLEAATYAIESLFTLF
jgi:hypothetical protein